MRMLTFALLLASATSIPAYAQFRGNDGMDAGEPAPRRERQERQSPQDMRSARTVINEGHTPRFEAMAQAREERQQRQSQAEPDNGRRGNWGDRQARPQMPVERAPQALPSGQWGGNRNGQPRDDVMTTNNPRPVPADPQNRGWQGRQNNANRHDGRNWNDRANRDQGQLPAPQRDGRRWDGNRNDGSQRDGRHWDGRHFGDGRVDSDRSDGRRWDGNRDGRRFNDGDRGWHREDNGRWAKRGDHDRHDRNWNNGYNNRDWNRTWRNDRRYDWQRYRNDYRHHYRQPRYYNPYGYRHGYRRFGIGIYLDSLFFSNRYWLNDPWEYRLPPAPYGCRWVRYYDDVLLVDTRSGYVVDAIHGFFW